MVKQLRAAWENSIKINSSLVGFISGNSVVYETVRISHERASVPTNQTNPVGLGTSHSFFVEMFYNSIITENTLLIFEGKGYRVNVIDEIKVKGDVFGKRAALTVIKTISNANLITSFKIGAVAGVINNTLNTITVTLPAGTAVTSLTPVIVHNGKLIDKTGAQDFTLPVEYTITAENLATKKYTATVVLA